MDLYFLSKVSFSDSIFAVFPCRGSSVQTKNRGLQYNDSGTTFYIYSFPFINSAKFAFKLNNFQSWSKINNKIANLHHRKGQSEVKILENINCEWAFRTLSQPILMMTLLKSRK